MNFEEGITPNAVAQDPRLLHLAHINNNAYVAVGTGLSKLDGNGKAEAVAARVDICQPISQYENPTDTMLSSPSGVSSCATNYSWAWKTNTGFHDQFGYVAVSPDKSFVLAAGVREVGPDLARWLVKLDAQTGQEIWQLTMPTTDAEMGKQSGYESIQFTADGGFIAGGWGINYEDGFPGFKSGGQVDQGTPIFQKFSASVASRSSPFTTAPTPEWTFKCDNVNCPGTVKGSMKTMKLFNDNGVFV